MYKTNRSKNKLCDYVKANFHGLLEQSTKN